MYRKGGVVCIISMLTLLIVMNSVASAIPVIFEVDVTGSLIPLNEYVSITNPPPPDGTGKVSIVGNQSELHYYTPNEVFLSDNGMGADAIAGDNIWTGLFDFLPGTQLLYKYTIGIEGNSWAGTEEFPLTMRGYAVPTAVVGSVLVHDIFADRPSPNGTLGPHSEVSIQTVPEPHMMLLFLISLGVVAFKRRT